MLSTPTTADSQDYEHIPYRRCIQHISIALPPPKRPSSSTSPWRLTPPVALEHIALTVHREVIPLTIGHEIRRLDCKLARRRACRGFGSISNKHTAQVAVPQTAHVPAPKSLVARHIGPRKRRGDIRSVPDDTAKVEDYGGLVHEEGFVGDAGARSANAGEARGK